MSELVPRFQRPRLAVATVANREHAGLLAQVDGLSMSTWPPDVHVAVAASDRELARNRLPLRSDRWETLIPRVQVHGMDPGEAFVAAVMMAGDEAVRAGAEVVVYLDVRCLPERELLQIYAEHAVGDHGRVPVLWHAAAAVQLGPPHNTGYQVAGALGALAAQGPVSIPQGPTSGPPAPWSDSFAVRAVHWPAVRQAWAAANAEQEHARPGRPVPSLAQAVIAAGGFCAQVPGALLYRQHPSAADARYLTATSDLPTGPSISTQQRPA